MPPALARRLRGLACPIACPSRAHRLLSGFRKPDHVSSAAPRRTKRSIYSGGGDASPLSLARSAPALARPAVARQRRLPVGRARADGAAARRASGPSSATAAAASRSGAAEAAQELRKRSRAALLAAARVETQGKLERELQKVDSSFSDQLGEYSKLHRRLDEVLLELEADYKECGDAPPAGAGLVGRRGVDRQDPGGGRPGRAEDPRQHPQVVAATPRRRRSRSTATTPRGATRRWAGWRRPGRTCAG